MSSMKVAYLAILLVLLSMMNVNSWRRRRRVCCKKKKKEAFEYDRLILSDASLSSKICEKEGLYAVEGGRLTPSSVNTETPIECNHRYCRALNLARGITCWRCKINREEFVIIDRENQQEIKCDVNSLGSHVSDMIEDDYILNI